MADSDSIRKRIISSVFNRRNASGDSNETYVSHVKIWEDAGSEADLKPRYILLARNLNGDGFIHKSKMNSNGTFSVGKTWKLHELRAIEVVNPLAFNITLARTYRWKTEKPNEQLVFLHSLVDLFRNVSNGSLQVVGLPEIETRSAMRSLAETSSSRDSRTPTPPLIAPRSSDSRRPRNIPSQNLRDYDDPPSNYSSAPVPRTTSTTQRPSPISSRPPSPPDTQASIAPTTPDIPSTQLRSSRIPLAGASSDMRSSIDTDSFSAARPSLDASSPPTPISRSTTSVIRPSSDSRRTPSPASSSRSKAKTKAQSRGPSLPPEQSQLRRDQNARISFFDPANQSALDRLIFRGSGASDSEGEEESTQDIMANVEEMLEGYEWASGDILGRTRRKGALVALENANIHSFIETDDRVAQVLKFLDDAILELDNMDSLVSSYKIHLNASQLLAVNDDILFIQSQNRGLQVQTQNQRALLNELGRLLVRLRLRLHMAATMERLEEYRTYNAQFCKRLYDYLCVMFTTQSTLLLGDSSGLSTSKGPGRLEIKSHKGLESYLDRYSGLVLYIKEMDEVVYGKLCAAYFSAASELHSTQMTTLLSRYGGSIKRVQEDDPENSFSFTPAGGTRGPAALRRVGTTIDRDMAAQEVLNQALGQISRQIYREEEFLADFLQINEARLTFADYMGLDSYFRRQAARTSGFGPQTTKLVRGAMDLIFGFLPLEMKSWIDHILTKDSMYVFDASDAIATHFILLQTDHWHHGCSRTFLADAEERGKIFFINLLDKQHTRLKGLFERHVAEQINAIEKTKLTSKKRNGVAHFIKFFPVYVGRVESQLVGVDMLEIRQSVDGAYNRIVQTMFDSLKQMAKMGGDEEDKGQLNYHVILVENMHYFVAEIRKQAIGSVNAVYEENLNAYVKIVLRRPFSKIIDYFDGVEQVLRTTAPSEVSSNSNYSRSSLKKVVKEFDSKDVRKHVDVLFKRVEKHFTEAPEVSTGESSGITPGTVMVGVWKACEEELLRITEIFAKRISQCYAKSGVSLEYTAADVEAAFKRHRVGP
ncbi:exocyst complex component Sec3-domain-containing protein [Lactifluus volemus]|nr:exocyst complex component Sec3-domain-containing protein [Lactifluus volemus]